MNSVILSGYLEIKYNYSGNKILEQSIFPKYFFFVFVHHLNIVLTLNWRPPSLCDLTPIINSDFV